MSLVPADDDKSINPLEGNTFGIELEGTVDDKIKRLLALIPMSFEVIDEALATIERLENEIISRGDDSDVPGDNTGGGDGQDVP